jgi:molecular chaperone DnaK
LTKLIESNTTIPTRKSQVFSTAADNQPSVEIHVLQGERAMAKDNKTIGRFHLDGIPPAPRGIPQVEVTFDIDANGLLNVSAKDMASGKEQKIRIEASSGLTDAEIEKMRQEAAANASEDQAAKESVETINKADSMVFQTEKQLKEFGEKLSENNKTAIEAALKDLRTSHAEKDVAKIKVALETLEGAWSVASQEMYANTGGNPQDPTGAAGQQTDASGQPSGANTEDVTDVDYEEVDSEKK